MLAIALKGVPRDSYRFLTKMRSSEATDLPTAVDRMRKQLGTEYIDIVLEFFRPTLGADTMQQGEIHYSVCLGWFPGSGQKRLKWRSFSPALTDQVQVNLKYGVRAASVLRHPSRLSRGALAEAVAWKAKVLTLPDSDNKRAISWLQSARSKRC